MTPIHYTLIILSLIGIVNADNLSASPETVGQLKGTIIYAVNEKDSKSAEVPEVTGLLKKAINSDASLKHNYYHELGNDQKEISRADENWLHPIQNSDQLKLRYDCKTATEKGVVLTISFWQENKKIFSTEPFTLSKEAPLIISGPDWREGKLLIAVELLP